MKRLNQIMLRIGWIVALAFYLATAITTIYQWFVPDHKVLICFNVFNEALFECVFVVLSAPLVMRFFREADKLIKPQ